jgi:hypothetical protein
MCDYYNLCDSLTSQREYENKKEEVIKKIEELVSKSSNFKIGKTGKDPKERFYNDNEYKERYDYPETVHRSSRKTEVDELEKDLIEYFRSSDEYSSMCDNEQEGGGEMDIKSGTYYIYDGWQRQAQLGDGHPQRLRP